MMSVIERVAGATYLVRSVANGFERLPKAKSTVDPTQQVGLAHVVDMLDQDVLCPQCNAQFRLRKVDSVEYKRKQAEAERIREIKAGNFWLNTAIVAAVLVGLLILGLIAMSILGGTPTTPKAKKSAAGASSTSRP